LNSPEPDGDEVCTAVVVDLFLFLHGIDTLTGGPVNGLDEVSLEAVRKK